MTQRIPLPDDVVGLIKAIVNQDRRERHAAGYKHGSNHLADRIAAALGLKLETVRKIKERKRRKKVKPSRVLQRKVTMEPEKLEEIRQRRIRDGHVATSWKRWNWSLYGGRLSYKKRLQAFPSPIRASDKPRRPNS